MHPVINFTPISDSIFNIDDTQLKKSKYETPTTPHCGKRVCRKVQDKIIEVLHEMT